MMSFRLRRRYTPYEYYGTIIETEEIVDSRPVNVSYIMKNKEGKSIVRNNVKQEVIYLIYMRTDLLTGLPNFVKIQVPL